MAELLIACCVLILLGAASTWADRRYCNETRLPMQWSFSGDVTWTAPRRLALAFTPGLGAVALGLAAMLAVTSGTPGHDSGHGELVLLVIGIPFLAAHALHLWLISRSVR